MRRWPYGMMIPGEPQLMPGQCGCGRLLVYVTSPVAGASGTLIDPVTLKPCEFDFVSVTERTWIGALPGEAWISMSFSVNGCACATSVTEADGTNTATANTPTASSVAAVM